MISLLLFTCCLIYINGNYVGDFVVTAFHYTESNSAFSFYRSLWASNAQVSQNKYLNGMACIYGDGDSAESVSNIESILNTLGVVVFPLDDLNVQYTDRLNLKKFANLLCTVKVANYLFMRGADNSNVLHVEPHYMVTGNIRVFLEIPDQGDVYCFPKLPPKFNQILNNSSFHSRSICEMDIFMLPSSRGAELNMIMESTLPYLKDLSAGDALDIASRSLLINIRFWSRNIIDSLIRGDRMWSENSLVIDSVVLVEIDGVNHNILVKDNCMPNLYVEWPHLKTVDILVRVFEKLKDNAAWYSAVGCVPLRDVKIRVTEVVVGGMALLLLADRVQAELPLLSKISVPRVFDTILFNDEIDLLLLRLQYMKNMVDFHIIVEAKRTFTGKEKPLHYMENKELFSEYAERIMHIILPSEMLVDSKLSQDVWNNEYLSRNAVGFGLDALSASDSDIVILNDVDELPHSDSIKIMKAISMFGSDKVQQRRIYRMVPLTFLYNFECFILQTNLFSAGSAVIALLGDVRSLASFSYDEANPHTYISKARMFMQSVEPYPFEFVMQRGGWHLSFFGGVEKIKKKLQSYSHQNFVRQFIQRPSWCENIADRLVLSDIKHECYDGSPILTSTGESIPRDLPETDKISVELIQKKIDSGIEIDNRNRKRCSKPNYDRDTEYLKSLYENIVNK